MKARGATRALAAFEARQALRNVRTWVLGILATIFGIIALTEYLLIYRLFSGMSGPFAYVTRDFWVFISAWALGMTLGLVGIFHAFDWRHRDEVARFSDTLAAAPLSRLQLVWGKFLGIALVLLAPFAVLLLAQGIAMAIARVAVPPATFVVGYVYGITAALVPTSVAFAVASLTRSRAAAIVAGLLFLAGSLASMFALPEEVAVIFGAAADMSLHSDFAGTRVAPLEIVQRASALLQVGLFVTLAAFAPLALPASPASSRRRVAAAGVLAVAVAATFAACWQLYRKGSTERHAIVAAEKAVAERPTPTVTRRDLEVRLAGERLEGLARLGLVNDTPAPLDEIVLRLNAGFDVSRVAWSGGPLQHRRDLTVLTVPLPRPLGPGETTTLELEYAGELDLASIDAELALANRAQSAALRGNQRLFGMTAGYLEDGVATLAADAGWYPEPGVLFGHEYPARHRQSFAPGTLLVRAPDGWTPASVGRRSREADGAWRFECDVPVPGVSLNAARFEEREMQAGGVTCRLLFHPDHARNVELLEECAPLLAQHVETLAADVLARTGLSYPHPELTVVEVPQSFAAFGPGWDTPNRMGAPGVVMLRESALLPQYGLALSNARKQFQSRAGGREDGGGEEVLSMMGVTVEDDTVAPRPRPAALRELSEFDPARAKLDVLKRFFRTDWAGGDAESLAFKSVWHHRAQALGPAAPLLGPVLASYQNERALGRMHLETPHGSAVFAPGNQAAGGMVMAPFARRDIDMGRVLLTSLTDVDEAYDIVQSTPIDQLDPRALGVEFLGALDLKGRRPLQAMAALLGDAAWNRAMARLLASPGGRFGWDEFRAAVLAEAPPEAVDSLAVLLDNWVGGTALPGFVVDRAVARRLEGDAERWQVALVVENSGDAPGIARVEVASGDDVRSHLVTLRAGERAEAGLVVPRKPERWTLRPFLSLNRAAPSGGLEIDERPAAAEPFEGVRPPQHEPDARIVFDNLDEGFTVTLRDGKEISLQDDADAEKRQVKPWVGFTAPSNWSRWRARSGWHVPYGRFDLTAVVKKGGKGDKPARWNLRLPTAGSYRLEAYLPRWKEKSFPQLPKSYSFVVHDASGTERPLAVDLPAQAGWTDLGRFDLGREVVIELRDEGTGLIIADAIRAVPEGA